MPIIRPTLLALAPLFGLIFLGAVLKRRRALHSSHVPILNSIVINITMPALIIRGLTGAPRLPAHDAFAPAALFLAQILALGAAWAAGRALRISRQVQGALLLTSAFGNTGFLGYPMALALLPSQFPAAVLLDQFGMTIFMYVCAAVLGSRLGGEVSDLRANMRKLCRSPLLLSVVGSVLFRLIPWPDAVAHSPLIRTIGPIIVTCLTYLGQGTTPIVLLALGVALQPGGVKSAGLPAAAAAVIKLVLCPVCAWGFALAFGLHGDLLRVCVLEASMPTAVVASVLSAQENLAGDFAVSVVFVTTALSAITAPIMMTVLR